MIDIRHKIHQHPEGGFQEFVTSKLIKDTLMSFGFPETIIKSTAKTGLTVDIYGMGPSEQQISKGVGSIALRADLDGLPMPEDNRDLEYCT